MIKNFNKILNDQIGNDGPVQTPQVLPLANLMNPCSPQAGLHEFLIVQASSLEPTKKTAWLRFVAQLLKTPDAYDFQFEASTLTAIGLLWIS